MSKDFSNSVLGQIIVSNLVNDGINNVRLYETRKKNQMQYYYSSLPVEMQLGNPSSIRPESVKTFQNSNASSKAK